MEELTFNDYVRLSIDAGVAPLELRFRPVVNFEEGKCLGYMTETVVHSINMGTLIPDEYTQVSDIRDCGVTLLQHNIQHAISAYKKLSKDEREILFISVRCSAFIPNGASLYDIVAEVIKKNPSFPSHKLCLEFSQDLLLQDTERTKLAMLDMKLLKVKTAITGCGSENFPLAKLTTVTPDFVFLAPEATSWSGSRNKPQLLGSMVSYIKSMGIDTIGYGEDKYRKAMRNTDAIGFVQTDKPSISLDEALSEGTEE